MANQFSDWFATPPQPGLALAFPLIKVPGGANQRHYKRASIILDVAPSAFAINDVARMCTIRSSDRISAMFVSAIAGTAVAVSVGLHAPGAAHDGAVVSGGLFGSGLVVAGTINRQEIFSQAVATNTWKRGQTIWELLGLTADPAVEYDVTYTCSTTLTTADSNNTLELYGAFD